MWKSINNDSSPADWQRLDIDPFYLNLTSSYTSSITTSTCFFENCSRLSSSSFSVTNNEEIVCLEDFECYDGSLQSLYYDVDCAGQCINPYDQTQLKKSYLDWYGNCCPKSQQDCAGICQGNDVVAYLADNNHALICCNTDFFPIDCAGICGGKHVSSPCGECNEDINTFQCKLSPSSLMINASNVLAVYYLSYSTRRDINQQSSLAGYTTTSTRIVLKEDDSPFEPVDLPRPFLFNGRYVSTIFLSPYGALHYSKEQPCYPDNNFLSYTADFNNAYYDLIGGILTDLNPSVCLSTTNLTLRDDQHAFTVTYNQFCYYGYLIPISFSISLFDDDDHVEINYFQVIRIANRLPIPNLWLSGLRPPKNYAKYIVFDDNQLSTYPEKWSTAIPGVYPADPSYLTSGYSFVACPISLF
jgi:hypothetical protein